MLLLDRAAELLPRRMRPQRNDRVMRDPPDRTVGPVQGHRDRRRLVEQTTKLSLQFADLPLHGNPHNRCEMGLQTTATRAPYHKSIEFLD
jgi:hypothetical protein